MQAPPTATAERRTALSPAERRELKARAHSQKPVVMIGGHGLTPAVMAEIGRALDSHELIKIHAAGDDRESRSGWLSQICAETGAEPIQHIGKILVIFRPRSEPEPEPAQRPRAAARRDGGKAHPAESKSRPAARRKAIPPSRLGLFEARKPDLKRLIAGTDAETAHAPARGSSRVGWEKAASGKRPSTARTKGGKGKRG